MDNKNSSALQQKILKNDYVKALNSYFEKAQFGTKARSKIWQKLRVCLKAGVTIGDALNMIWVHASDDGRKPDHPIAKIIAEWRKEMADGKPLNEAVKRWVPESEQTIIAAGEESDLVQAIEDLLKIQEAKKKISSTIIKGLIYPIVLLLAGCVFLIMFSVRIVPQFSEVLPRNKWEGTPAIMANIGDFFTHYLIVIILAIIGMMIAVSISMPRWTGKSRVFFDKLPPWSLYRLYSGSSFMLIVSAMLSSGSPPLKIINTMRRNASPWFDERLASTERFLRGGKNLGEALYETGYDYPDKETVRDLRSYAGQSDFANTLRRLGDLWIEESIGKVAIQTAIMKNVAMAFAAGVIIGFLLSIFDLEMQVQGSQGGAG